MRKLLTIVQKKFVNKIENRNMFKTKTGYYLELLTSEVMKLLRSTKSKITKNNKNSKNASHWEITEVAFVHCDIVSNDYQQDSRVLYTFIPNKYFSQLLDISPQSFIILKIRISEFAYIKYGLQSKF